MANATNPSALETLLWLDFEFTGLDIRSDVVLEVGSVLTDWHLNELAEFSTFISYPVLDVSDLIARNRWWDSRPNHRQEILRDVQGSTTNLDQASKGLTQFAREHCPTPVILAGNSIYNDRKWVDRDFPELSKSLHYRMLDVSSFKLVTKALAQLEYEKVQKHRALDDIKESI
jgi:oligoribonuclease